MHTYAQHLQPVELYGSERLMALNNDAQLDNLVIDLTLIALVSCRVASDQSSLVKLV